MGAARKIRKANKMAAKRFVTVPESREMDVENPWVPKGTEVDFVGHVIQPLLEDKRWGQTRKTGRASIRVEDAFEGAEGGAVVELNEDDWQILRDAADEPSNGYRPGMLRCLERWGWLDAITEAPKEDPREESAEAEEKKAS